MPRSPQEVFQHHAEALGAGDLDAIVDAVRPYWEAGFTDIALLQIGGEAQDLFLKEAAESLLAELRAAATARDEKS